MKPIVNQDICVGCGNCNATCPEVFLLNEENKAYSLCDVVSTEFEDIVKTAKDNCPVGAIFLS